MERVAAINNHLHQFYFEFEVDKSVIAAFNDVKADRSKLKASAIDESKKVYQMKVAMKTFFSGSVGKPEEDLNFRSSLNKLRDKMNKPDSASRGSRNVSPENTRKNSDKGSKAGSTDERITAVTPFIPSLSQFLSASLIVNPEEPFKKGVEAALHSSSLKPIDDLSYYDSVSNFGGDAIDSNMIDFYHNFDMGTLLITQSTAKTCLSRPTSSLLRIHWEDTYQRSLRRPRN